MKFKDYDGNESKDYPIMKYIILVCIIVGILIALSMWGMPRYRVYKLELDGKAQLKQAEWNRQIAIEEAQAEKAAATLKKEH